MQKWLWCWCKHPKTKVALVLVEFLPFRAQSFSSWSFWDIAVGSLTLVCFSNTPDLSWAFNLKCKMSSSWLKEPGWILLLSKKTHARFNKSWSSGSRCAGPPQKTFVPAVLWAEGQICFLHCPVTPGEEGPGPDFSEGLCGHGVLETAWTSFWKPSVKFSGILWICWQHR